MKSRIALGLLTLLFALAAAPAVTAQEESAPSVTVSPDTTLEDGDKVDVSGTGFPPGVTVFVMLCNGDERLGDSVGRCSLVGTGAEGYVVDVGGGFVASDVVVPVGQVGASELASCPPSPAQAARGVSCEIEVVTADFTEVAGVNVTYDGQAPAAPSDLAFTGLRGTIYLRVGSMFLLVGVLMKGMATLFRRDPEPMLG